MGCPTSNPNYDRVFNENETSDKIRDKVIDAYLSETTDYDPYSDYYTLQTLQEFIFLKILSKDKEIDRKNFSAENSFNDAFDLFIELLQENKNDIKKTVLSIFYETM